jgi:hypothetical protein
LLKDVLPFGPGGRAGLKEGDELVSLGGVQTSCFITFFLGDQRSIKMALRDIKGITNVNKNRKSRFQNVAYANH